NRRMESMDFYHLLELYRSFILLVCVKIDPTN
ncbi:MAG: hypothetical protein ACJAWX_002295, partial [Algoriphagus sp.]